MKRLAQPTSSTVLRPIADTISGFKAAANPVEALNHYEILARQLWMPPLVEQFGHRFFNSAISGKTAWASVSAPYGFGKTAAAICLWQRARNAGFLAIPPLSCTSFDELAAAIEAVASAQVPSLRSALRELRLSTWRDELDQMARSDSSDYGIPQKILRRLFHDKAQRGRLAFTSETHQFVEFLSKMTRLAANKCKGLIIVIDELQQLLGPLDVRAINRFREFVWGTRTERAKFGVILALDTLLESRLARWAEDILHRIREGGLTIKLTDVYTKEFPRWLWANLTDRNGSKKPRVERIAIADDVLLSLGQLVERSDLANGPRTVVDVFQRAVDHFKTQKKQYRVSDLTDDIQAGRLRYLGEGYPIQKELARLLSDEWIATNPVRQSVVKALGTFPQGCPDTILRRAVSNAKRLNETVTELFPSVLVRLAAGWALEGLQQVRRPVTNWEQILQQCWERLPGLDALSAHVPDFVLRILIARLFPRGNPSDPQWEATSTESVAALTGWRRFRGSFDPDFPKREVAIYINNKRPSSWPEDTTVAFAFVCDDDLRSSRRPSAVVGSPGRIELHLPMFRPLEHGIPAEVSRYSKFIQPEPFRPATILAALHELKSFVDFKEQDRVDSLAAGEMGRQPQVDSFVVSATDLLLSELFEGAVSTAVGKPITLRGTELIRALFSESCRYRFPHYRTLMRTPRWRQMLNTYHTALISSKLDTRALQGGAEIEGKKSEIYEKLFAQNSTAAGDSLVRALGPLLRVSGDSKCFKVRLALHPGETALLHYLRKVPRNHEVPNDAAIEFLHHQGYLDEEATHLIDLLAARHAIAKQKRTIKLSGGKSSSTEWIQERTRAIRKDLASLGITSNVTTENGSNALKVLEILEEELNQSISGISDEVEDADRKLSTLIGSVQASTVPDKWVVSDLSVQLCGISALLTRVRDELLRRLRKKHSWVEAQRVSTSDGRAETAIAIHSRFGRLRDEWETLERQIGEFQKRVAALANWVGPNTQLGAARELATKISSADPGPTYMLDRLVAEFRERFAVEEWKPIFAFDEFSERLHKPQTEIQNLLFRHCQAFYRERSALLTAYPSILPISAPDFADAGAKTYNGNLPQISYERLYDWACSHFETAIKNARDLRAAGASWRDPRSTKRGWPEIESRAMQLLREARKKRDYESVLAVGVAVTRISNGFLPASGSLSRYDDPQKPPDFAKLAKMFHAGLVKIQVEAKR
jgi:hypothetical protein